MRALHERKLHRVDGYLKPAPPVWHNRPVYLPLMVALAGELLTVQARVEHSAAGAWLGHSLYSAPPLRVGSPSDRSVILVSATPCRFSVREEQTSHIPV